MRRLVCCGTLRNGQLRCERDGGEPTHLRLCWAVQALVLALADPVEVLLEFRIARVR